MWVRVYYHIVRATNGTGGFDPNQLSSLTTRLNKDYNKYGILFSYKGFEYIDDSQFYNMDASLGSTIFYKNRQADAVDVYLVNSYIPASGEVAISGCAQYLPSTALLCVNAAALGILSHEMGHCLGLFHTHRGANYGPSPETGGTTCEEMINGSNCNSCGDYMCDTPASPNLQYFSNSNCQYTGSFTQNGQPFNPSVNNIMSYAPDNCRTVFSQQQVYAMKNTLNSSSARETGVAETTISGPAVVCGSASFNCSNVRAGYAVVNWSSSNPGIASINSSGVVTRNSDGVVTLTASIANNGHTYFVSKDVYVGVPPALSGTYQYGTFVYAVNNPSTGIGVSNSTPNITINLQQSAPSISFVWATVSSGGSSSFSPNGPNASLYLAGGAYRNISCYPTNACGNGPTTTFNCYNYSGGFRLVASPNPTSLDLTVTATDVLTEQEALDLLKSDRLLLTDDLKKVDLVLYDKNGVVVAKGKFTDKKVKFNTQSVPNGTYYLHVGEGANVIKLQIMILH